MIGIEPLADRLLLEFKSADGAADEALLTLADFLIVLSEVSYQPSDGGLSRADFERVFRPFLGELTEKLRSQIAVHRDRLSEDLLQFWERVVKQCRP